MDKLSMERPDRGQKKFDSSKLARHTEKCHKMFDEIANGRTMYIKIDDIFPEYEAENETASGIQYVEMSVLTDEISSDEGIVLNGTMVSSASPVNYIEKRVLIFTNMAMKKAVLKEINSLYAPSIFTCKSNLQIEKE